ncbi:MAG: hypothetical protein RRY07_09825, partial [Bacteroidaceae bacterium]
TEHKKNGIFLSYRSHGFSFSRRRLTLTSVSSDLCSAALRQFEQPTFAGKASEQLSGKMLKHLKKGNK